MATARGLVIDIGMNVARLQQDVNKATSNIHKFTRDVKSAFGSIAAGAAVTSILYFTKSTINMLDNIGDTAQKVGVAADTLQLFQEAAKISGASAETVSTAIGKMSKEMLAATEGTETATRKFRSFGLEIKDGSGNLKTADKMLMEVADKFKGMEDGTSKTAWAMELFGRSGKEMIPMLNAGSAGLAKMKDEFERLGIIIDNDTIRLAGEVNDKLDILAKAFKNVAVRGIAELLPAFDTASTAIINFLKDTATLKTTADSIGTAFKLLASTVFIVAGVFDMVGTAIGDTLAYLNTLGTKGTNTLDDLGLSMKDLGLETIKTAGAMEALKSPDILPDLEKKLQKYVKAIQDVWNGIGTTVGKTGKTGSAAPKMLATGMDTIATSIERLGQSVEKLNPALSAYDNQMKSITNMVDNIYNDAIKKNIALTIEQKTAIESFVAQAQKYIEVAEMLKMQVPDLDPFEFFSGEMGGPFTEEDIEATVNYIKGMERLREEVDTLNVSMELYAALQQETFGKGAMRSIENMNESFGNFGALAEEMTTGAFNEMGKSLADFCTTGQMNFEAFKNSIIAMISEMIIKFLLLKAVMMAVGFGGGGGGFSTGFGDWTGGLGFHKGGIAGVTAPTFMRAVPASTFNSAQKYHSGLAYDEIPAILQRGETVIPKGAGNIVVNVTVEGNVITERKLARSLAPLISKAQREGVH